jgi:chemotaxis protein MotA
MSVFGGYALEGGHLAALLQPLEVLMIAGAGIGAFILGNGVKTIKATLRVIPALFKGSKYDKEMYMELMALLYVLLAKARKEGTLTLEADIDEPHKSPIFMQYPKILANKETVEFLTDYLRLMVGGNMNAFEIESLMDEEIETHHAEGGAPAAALSKVGDAMPAFGIVAAVMGVVHTMASADKPPAVLGEMIAQALVGTFLGILLSYGLINPLSGLAEQRATEATKVFQCIKVTILASLNGYAPAIAVEFGRKVLFSTERPSFTELEEHVRRVKAK